MLLVRNATLLDPATGDLTEGAEVLVEGERIREASARPIKVAGALTLDAGGRTTLLQGQGEHLALIMKAGALYRNRRPVA